MNELMVTDVFTPSDFPVLTYVERTAEKLEQRLQIALDTPGEIISISGPSKSGKTVLVEKVVGRDNLIAITGAGLRVPEELWQRILDWMEAPTSEVNGASKVTSTSGTGKIKGEGGFPGVAKVGMETEVTAKNDSMESNQVIQQRRGMQQVIDEIAKSDYVLFVDDFHYMDSAIQTEVSKQIKEAARQGVKICVAAVPHRADDVVRSNPELRGRVCAIDVGYWTKDELKLIAEKGFQQLQVKVDKDSITQFASEAAGSPQLMQAICLQTCFGTGVKKRSEKYRPIDLHPKQAEEILFETSTRTDFRSMVRKMHEGPKSRGSERKEYKFKDESTGDMYRSVLLALANDPPRMTHTFSELSWKIQKVAKSDIPPASSIILACEQITKIVAEMYPSQRIIEWDGDVLEIIDPYLLFYLRWSGVLDFLIR